MALLKKHVQEIRDLLRATPKDFKMPPITCRMLEVIWNHSTNMTGYIQAALHELDENKRDKIINRIIDLNEKIDHELASNWN